jgi:hypothetical protein
LRLALVDQNFAVINRHGIASIIDATYIAAISGGVSKPASTVPVRISARVMKDPR